MGVMGGNQRNYSANHNDYRLLEEIGSGASATVYRAIYHPFNEVVAVKCLDLDRCNSNLIHFTDLRIDKTHDKRHLYLSELTKDTQHWDQSYLQDDIRREAQTMSLIDHPNVIRAYCSFVVDHNLWVVMPFMAEGSCLHLMKTAYPDGFEEAAISSILKETLKALDYLHQQGHIHRDVKAGNILLDANVIKLADFGVSACMFDNGDRQRARNTFVGTPCWMAPEVLQPGSGYNSKADIWSFGITALELAHGHAPFSKYPPMKVLLMTIQNAPPGLDYDRDKRFSKSFKEMVAMCLVKDQTKRPTAEKLLKHSFFKRTKPPELSVKKLFEDLPPLWDRVKALQLKDAAQLALKRMPSAEQEAISLSEYQRGVSAWNFDIEDLKAQASLVQDDDDDMSEIREEEESMKLSVNYKAECDGQQSFGKLNINNGISQMDFSGHTSDDYLQGSDSLIRKGKILENVVLEPVSEENIALKKTGMESLESISEKEVHAKVKAAKSRQTQSGPLKPSVVLTHSSSEKFRSSERIDGSQTTTEKIRGAPSFSGPLMLPNRASANSLSAPIKSSGGFRDSMDDKTKANLVQIKGRFSVTSENLDLVKDIPISTVPRQFSRQGSPMKKSASVGERIFESKSEPTNQPSKEYNSNAPAPNSFLMPHLHNLIQQNSVQQDVIMNLLNSLRPLDAAVSQDGKMPTLPQSSESNGSIEPVPSEREQLLLIKISELQARHNELADELESEKRKHTQLQQKFKLMSGPEENGSRREKTG